MISGAKIMVKCLEQEGVDIVFGYPGAAICPFFDELADTNIQAVLVRQEQNAAHAASGYARTMSKVGVCVATSGPGALNLITGIATAYMDSVPMIAITGQVRSDVLGRDVFQEADITGACESFVKHSYLVKDTAELPRIFKEAFHIASTGRPGPVLIDVPVDIQENEIEAFTYPSDVNIIGYKPSVNGHPVQIKRALEMIKASKRPIICAGGGVLSAGAEQELFELVDKTGIPIVSTMMGIGVVPMGHRAYVGMLGSHGLKSSNTAVHESDLIILCGARVGDRAVASPDQVVQHANVIHIDIDPAEIGKNMKTTIPIVGDAKNVLAQMLEGIDYEPPTAWADWLKKIRSWQTQFYTEPTAYPNCVEPKEFIYRLSKMMKEGDTLVADVGNNQIWCANNFKPSYQGKFLTSGGMGTMGYAIPAAMGAGFADDSHNIVSVCGDGSFQMVFNELATISQNHLNVKMIVMQNRVLGMVHELQDVHYNSRYAITELGDSPDFTVLAQAYGIESKLVSSNGEAEKAAEEMLNKKGPFLLICNVDARTTSRGVYKESES